MPCIAHLPDMLPGNVSCTVHTRRHFHLHRKRTNTHNACVVCTRFVCSTYVTYAHGTFACTPIHDTIMTHPRAHAHENAQRIYMHMAFTAMYMRSMQASISCTVEARRTYIILMHGTCLTQGNAPCTVYAHHSYARHALSTCMAQSGHMHIRHMQHDVCRLQHYTHVKCPAHARHMHFDKRLTHLAMS